jgi:hypothetical protein
VAKKSKIELEKQADTPAPSVAGNGLKPAPPPPKKPRATAKPKAKKTAAKQKTPKATASRPAEKPSPASAPAEPSDEAIRLRAYFLAERRAKLSLPGDSAHDWIEARRQLIEEAGRGK